MKRLLLNPVVWVVDLLATWVGVALDEACELFDLDGEDHE